MISELTRKRISLGAIGNSNASGKRTEEQKLRMRNAQLGKKLSEEHKKRIGDGGRGTTMPKSAKIKISNTLKGHKVSKETRNKLSEAKWQGENISYSRMHNWLHDKLGKANKCEFADNTCSIKFEWSNISGEYHRDLNDFQQLCVSHHKRYDNNLRKLRGKIS